MIDEYILFVILMCALFFCLGYLMGIEPNVERCPKCGNEIESDYKTGPTYLIKKCTSCKWKSKEKVK